MVPLIGSPELGALPDNFVGDLMRKIAWHYWLLIGVAAAAVVAVVEHSRVGPQEAILKAPIEIGRGIGDIHLQQTTMAQLTAKLGERFQRDEVHGSMGASCVDGKCSDQYQEFVDIVLDYKEAGLQFLFRRMEPAGVPDSELKLRFVRVYCVKSGKKCRFQGETDRGIHLQSLRKEVLAAHGDNITWTGQQGVVSNRGGINFAFDSEFMKIQDTDQVVTIDIFSPADFGEYGHRSI